MPIDAPVGRRKKTAIEKRSELFPPFRVTKKELEILQAAAARAGLDPSKWAREKLLEAAGQSEDPNAELRQLKARMEKLLRG